MAKDATTKVIVRLLPPEITEEELYQSIGEEHLKHAVWRSFQPGKRYKGEAKPSRNSRCYIQFDGYEALEYFLKDYHGHQFVDDRGEPFRAVACYAPCQKLPRQKVQKDSREGTIEDDPMYKAFLESLGKPKALQEPPPNPATEIRPADPGDTPLLAYMKKVVKDKKAKAERRAKKWDYEDEGGKRSKWYCSECYTTNVKKLEEDPDNRGTFYCKRCWEAWESHPTKSSAAAAKKKKKKKGKDYEYEEEYEEQTTSKHHKSSKSSDTKSEWRVKSSTSKAAPAEEEAAGQSRRKKKKDKYYEEEEEEERDTRAGRGRRTWQPKVWVAASAADEQEEEGDKERKGRRGKAKNKEQDDWWRDSGDTGGGSSSRWRIKAKDGGDEAEKEEKSRRARTRHRKAEEEEETTYWKAKSRHAK